MAQVTVSLARMLFTVILFSVATVCRQPVGDSALCDPTGPKPRVLQKPCTAGHYPKDPRTAEVARLATCA